MLRKVSIPIIALALFSLVAFGSHLLNFHELVSPDSKIELNVMEDENSVSFNTMMDVLTHQRCMNCHPSDNIPKQGEDSHPHRFDISRNNANASTNCNTCHQDSNNDFSGVPGAPHWSLAPQSMRWEGLSRIEIAQSMTDKTRNGNRSLEDLMHHLTEHELVMWAWKPGLDLNGDPRETPPVSKEKYIAAVKKRIEEGAIIPETSNK